MVSAHLRQAGWTTIYRFSIHTDLAPKIGKKPKPARTSMEALKIDPTRNPDQLRLPHAKGTYVLILCVSQTVDLEIGRLGIFRFASGYYAYVGSAFGPGGLAARIQHHQKKAQRPHWHIDYLRAKTQITEIWCDTGKVEHKWAESLGLLKRAQIPVKGFGCSDCRCQSHLFYYPERPGYSDFNTMAGQENVGFKTKCR